MSDDRRTILAFDSGSKNLSVALAVGSRISDVEEPQSRSSTQLPRLCERLLTGADLTWSDLDAVIAARGPGSFTGLRVGLAFALGLHQAIGIRATAISTLRLLAAAADLDRPLTAAVNAWRDSWFVQTFDDTGSATGEPERIATADLTKLAGPVVVAEPVDGLPTALGIDNSIAVAALGLASSPEVDWDPTTLQQPLYLAPPPATLPRRPTTARA